SLGDVSESLHQAAVGEMTTANLHDSSTWHCPFTNRELAARIARRDKLPRLCAGRPAIRRLRQPASESGQLVEARRVLDELLRQPEQLAAPAVDDWNLQVPGDQHDSLAHVLEREVKLLRLMPCLRLGPQDSLHGHEDDHGQY